ncbi:phosphatidate cytidylyltransferase [Secundilactobacillus kimchicus]|uniref:Phosphatidate cytidylyltransferase n=1 Tax=Secundilactobacillus kimchicus JCM 15530 TaxID=1302272 RepID=A0A0R1HSP1_9LACO|nr:phosphatidate cytidylyltransferase [Secundilactobacillus kimchicus]KRK49446.1 CDP-diglyceride synthetase [Secundilactobacillus kimchicus JCM 15530]
MKQRVITAVVALIIFIPIIIMGGIWVDIAAAVLGLVALSELLVMRKKLLVSPEAIISGIAVLMVILPDKWLGFLPPHLHLNFLVYVMVILLLIYSVVSKNRFSFDDAAVLTLGIFYIGMGFHYFIEARKVGFFALLFALLIVWITDSGAYMIGRKLGRHKLAPHISPNKTWEGSIGGTLVATVIVGLYAYFYPQGNYSLLTTILLIVIVSVIGQFGDLVESALKRYYGVKDSGKILPGHGGILDRFDSLLLVLPALHLLNFI